MKNLFLLICLIFSLLPVSAGENVYKVLKVVDGDTVYLDFNRDGIIQKDERVRLNGIDTFEVKPSPAFYSQVKFYNLSEDEVLAIAYLAKEFAKKNLLQKDVEAVYSGETKNCSRGRHLMSIYYKDESGKHKNYEEEILKAGMAVVFSKSNLAQGLKRFENLKKMMKNLSYAKNSNLKILDLSNGIYYSPYCKYAHGKGYFELIDLATDNNGYIEGACP